MDVGFTEEQEMLKKSARDFLEKEFPKDVAREMEKDEKGYTQELWRKMAGLGWMGLVIPEKYGGADQSFLDLAILLEEMGRAVLIGPFFTAVVLGALPILNAGTEEQKGELLPKIANGDLIITLALNEPGVNYYEPGIATTAKADGDNYVISGTKVFVPYAHVADYILCAAKTGGGTTLFLVDSKSSGIKVTILDTMADDKQCEVVFDNVKVPKKNILGALDKGWPLVEKIVEQAAVAEAAEIIGGMQQVLEMSTEYAKTRVQFGTPIGVFQVIKHRCADQMTDTEAAKYIVYQAAWMISEGLPCSKEASFAKAWVNDASRRVCVESQQTHAGIGITDDYDLGFYTRRAKVGEFIYGNTPFHLEKVAQELGL